MFKKLRVLEPFIIKAILITIQTDTPFTNTCK